MHGRELQIVKGTILGGSSIVKPTGGKNCYLSMRCKNEKWLTYKASELAALSSYKPITIEKTNRWHSLCYPLFNDMRDFYYNAEGERQVTVDSLDALGLNSIAFMIWFGDVGQYRNNQVVLNTHIWGENGTNAIVSYFKLLGFDSQLVLERKNFRLQLDEKSSTQFMKMVTPLLPHSHIQSLNTAHQ
jgi:hypothetical protein